MQKEIFLQHEAWLPRTVKHITKIVFAMGQRLLWVDRLCIVQDNEAHKAAKSEAMGAVYANTYFTMAAAEAHGANDGIWNVGDSFESPMVMGGFLNIADSTGF
jgi:hypothetical protein